MTSLVRLTALTALAAALILAPTSQAEAYRGRRGPAPTQERSGFQLGGGLGLNVCVPDDGADCDSIGALLFLRVAPGYRFDDSVSLSLDVEFGALNPEPEGVEMSSYTVMPTLRGHLRAGRSGEIVLGAGVGYSSLVVSATGSASDAAFEWRTYLAFKLSFGYLVEVSPRFAVGAMADFIINPDNGELCLSEGFDEYCEDNPSGGDIAERLNLGVYGQYRF